MRGSEQEFLSEVSIEEPWALVERFATGVGIPSGKVSGWVEAAIRIATELSPSKGTLPQTMW
jgi:hypothetical protein